MSDGTRRIDRILDASYVEGLDGRDADELRVLKAEANEVETEVSYVRRLAQGRLDIIRAERDRRARGGSLEELISNLPRILAADASRAPAAQARAADLLAPSPDITFSRGAEPLIDDSTLARLPDLSDDELDRVERELTELESDMSTTRRALHGVIDTIERAIAVKVAPATAGDDQP